MADMIHTTPMGHILNAMTASNWHDMSWDDPDLRDVAHEAVEKFLMDLAADGPIVVTEDGSTVRVQSWVAQEMLHPFANIEVNDD